MKLSRNKLIFIRNIVPLFVALTICIIGYIGIYFYSVQSGRNLNKDTSQHVTNKLDSLLSSLKTSINIISSLSQIDCQQGRTIFDKIITSNSFITSIELIKDGQLYCASHNISLKAKDYRQYLAKPSFIFGKTTVLLVHNPPNNSNLVLIKLDNKVLLQLLQPRIPTQVITLELDNNIISYNGLTNQNTHFYNAVSVTSTQSFPYRLTVAFTNPTNLEILLSYHGVVFLVIFFLALIFYIISRLIIENFSGTYFELDRAIRNKEIKTYVQPVYSAKERAIIGVEILTYWHHPIAGIIPPNIFIPIAEQIGLLIPMTQLIFKQVGRAFAPYVKSLNAPFSIGFNISRVHCQNLKLIDDCKKFFKYLGSDNITLIIEITERELIEVSNITKTLFKELHKLNIKIALDDFGVGNSNLSYLYDFAVDYLKIDRSFISRFGTDALSKNILDSIIEIAQNCHLESCAEGIESEFQADYLTRKGVDYLQGYYFSKPLLVQDFIKSADFKRLLILSDKKTS